MEKDKIYIIGSGAIGKSLAVFLQHENKDVILIRGSIDNKPSKKISIKVTNQERKVFQEKITTTTFSNLTEINGIVLISTKAFANNYLSEKLKEMKGNFSIVLLQNGLNIERPFDSFDEIYRCVLFSGGQVISNNNVSFKRIAPSPVGRIRGSNSQLNTIVNQINTPLFGFQRTQNISTYIWDKVIINCAFNSICPLLETDNGIFNRNPEAEQLAKTVIAECVTLAGKYNVVLDQKKIEKDLMLISKHSEGQLVSTFQDIIRKRKTEIENLNLEISRLAEEIEMPNLVVNTRLLGEMVLKKSEINFPEGH